MDFEIGQIFEGTYPPEAVLWCNQRGDCGIYEIEPLEDGTRRFQIVAIQLPPLPELEAYKEKRLIELNTLHEAAEKEAHVLSSLGFEIDANDRANRDIAGLLVTTAEDQTVQFMGYDNVAHEVTRADLEVMQREIIQNAQYLYTQKWNYRSQIEAMTTSQALSQLSFQFYYMSFYTQA